MRVNKIWQLRISCVCKHRAAAERLELYLGTVTDTVYIDSPGACRDLGMQPAHRACSASCIQEKIPTTIQFLGDEQKETSGFLCFELRGFFYIRNSNERFFSSNNSLLILNFIAAK